DCIEAETAILGNNELFFEQPSYFLCILVEYMGHPVEGRRLRINPAAIPCAGGFRITQSAFLEAGTSSIP
ncbi:MAG TPA: hypothetical protein PK360_15290, partial [bacterium]|nr:hypothetical protein [bacterium]